MTAAEYQLAVWRLARDFFQGAKAAWIGDLLEMWGEVAREIGRDPLRLKEWLDWPFKLSLLQKSDHDFSDGGAKAIDLLYHGVDPEVGVFLKKEAKGIVKRLVKDGSAPVVKGTRAFFRGFLVREKSHLLRDLSWETAVFHDKSRPLLMDPFLDEKDLSRILSEEKTNHRVEERGVK